jgi:plastocyanin
MLRLRSLAAPVMCALAAMLAGSAGAPAGTAAKAAPHHRKKCRAAVHARHSRARSHAACHSTHHSTQPAKKPPATLTPAPSSGTGGGSAAAPAPGQAPQADPTQSTPPAGPPVIPHVQITAVEFSLTLSRANVPHGKVVLQFVNNGQDEHNLSLQPSEGPAAGTFANTPSKGVINQTIEMRPGSYTLFCSLPEHEQKGMKATLTVE